MRAAVHHVHHRRGQNVGVDAAEVAIERNLEGLGHGAGGSQRDGKNGVGAQLALVRRAVELDHGLVDEALVAGVHALQLGGDDGLHIGNGLQNALAEIVALVAVAQFHGLMLAGRGARRHNGAAECAAFQNHVRFNGGVTARVQDFAGTDGNNLSHIAPHDAVLQPVIQFRTAVYGKSFTGSALNRFYQLRHDAVSSPSICLWSPCAGCREGLPLKRSSPAQKKQRKSNPPTTMTQRESNTVNDSSKSPGCVRCGGGHRGRKCGE